MLQTGAEQTIRLPSLSGAGYAWSVEVVGGDAEAVAVREVDPDASPGPPGESPDHVFRLSARRPGTAMLRFEQQRPWQADEPPHDARTFEVVVDG